MRWLLSFGLVHNEAFAIPRGVGSWAGELARIVQGGVHGICLYLSPAFEALLPNILSNAIGTHTIGYQGANATGSLLLFIPTITKLQLKSCQPNNGINDEH